MKVLKVVGVSALALGLVFGLASPALAAPPDWASSWASHMPPAVLMGEVISVDASQQTFGVQSGEREVTVSVDSDTHYYEAPIPWRAIPPAKRLMELRQQSQERLGLNKWLRPFVGKVGSFFKAVVPWGIPCLVRHQLELRQQAGEEPGLMGWLRPFAEEATFDDLTVGTQVVVLAESGEDNPLAKLVIIIEPTGYGHVLGTITDVSSVDKTITIAPADGGEEIILSYDEGTRFILCGIPGLEMGQSIRAIYDEDMTAKVVFSPVEVP
jgi:hypothetical protein